MIAPIITLGLITFYCLYSGVSAIYQEWIYYIITATICVRWRSHTTAICHPLQYTISIFFCVISCTLSIRTSFGILGNFTVQDLSTSPQISSPCLAPNQFSQVNWMFTEAEMMGWQWHQLDHMQVICTSLQTVRYVYGMAMACHARTSSLKFFSDRMLFLLPNQQFPSTDGNK